MSTLCQEVAYNHIVTGTCGECNGPVTQPIYFSGTVEPGEYCTNCGRRAKSLNDKVYAPFGPIREMVK